MGQKLRDDKIGALSHNAGTITLTASSLVPTWITIGGQQYKVTSNLARTIASDVTLTANNLYMIYAVVSGGNVQLRVSSNVNSIGPVGFPSWKLVGAFYAQTGNTFGVFVTIEGPPTSQGMWNAGPIDLRQNSVAVTKSGTETKDRIDYVRKGKMAFARWGYSKNGAGGSAPGGNWHVVVNVFNADTSQYASGATEDSTSGGAGHITTPSDGRVVHVNFAGSSTFEFVYTTPSNVVASNTTHPYATGTFRLSGAAWYPVTNWSDTPLKDL